MELLDQKKTAQPQEQDPKDDLLDHWRTQAATIEPKPRLRRRWLRLKDLEDSSRHRQLNQKRQRSREQSNTTAKSLGQRSDDRVKTSASRQH